MDQRLTGSELRICFFSHSSELAGAERCLLDLVSQLIADNGVTCTVVTPGDGPLVPKLQTAGATVIPASYGWWCDWDSCEAQEARARITSDIERLWEESFPAIRQSNPDVICTNSIVIPYGALTAAALGKPHIWNIREYGIRDNRLLFFLPIAEVLSFIRGTSDFIFGATKRLCRTLFSELDQSKCKHLYPAIEIPEIEGSSDESAPVRPRELTLAELASLVPFKQQDIAVRAVAELTERGHDVELRLQGKQDPSYVKKLQQLVLELGIEDRVLIRRFSDNVYPVMRSTDVLVISDPVHAFGRLAAEGMRLGKPVVYPGESDISEYMQDGLTGLAYSARSPTAMADVLERLIGDPGLRVQIGDRARQVAIDTFTRDGFSGRFFRRASTLASTKRTTDRRWLINAFLNSLLEVAERAGQDAAQARTDLEFRSQALIKTQTILAARDGELSAIKPVLQAREEELAAVKSLIEERDQELAAIRPVLDARDKELAAIRPVLEARDEELAAVKPTLHAREKELSALKPALEERENDLKDLQRRFADLRGEMARLGASRLGRLALRICKVR